MVTTFAGSAINTAVVKYTAEYHEDETKQRAVWKTAGSIVFLFSLVFGLCCTNLSVKAFSAI
ncbi:polysaccharide biosynthesis domain protein [Acinetobacter baumannii 348935]|nr:polysaccharide biosynthesis domain protein [Acinetobacter baumannii 348935]